MNPMKKIIVTALALVFLTSLMAQKRVVVLLPCQKGGQELATPEKEVVRSGMIDAINALPGFDAFVNSAVDQLFEEYNYSQNCNLSDYLALKVTTIVAADYILASSAMKEGNTLYVSSYAMNAVTAETTSEFSGQSALKRGVLNDCSELCQSLIEPMLNPAPPQQEQEPAPQTENTPKQPSAEELLQQLSQLAALQKALEEETAKEKAIHAVVGEIIVFSDGSRGLCFYVEKGHGLAVSLDQAEHKWDSNRSRKMQDISLIPNQKNLGTFEMGRGFAYTNAILSQVSQSMVPATAWCRMHGAEWYLPTAEEMNYLLRIANQGKGGKGTISKSLVKNGGKALDEDWYWSSSENERDEAINVGKGGKISSEDKDKELPVRAVRAF